MINNEDIGLIKSYVNMPMLIKHFNIFINQKNYAICPFHNDKSPSMQIFNGYKAMVIIVGLAAQVETFLTLLWSI